MMEKSLQIQARPFSETDPEIRGLISKSPAGTAAQDGILFFRIGDTVYSCQDTPEGRLLSEAGGRNVSVMDRHLSEPDVWRRILKGSVPGEILRSFGIKEQSSRCVVLFRPLQSSFQPRLLESIPLEEKDRLVLLEDGDAALVLSADKRTREEILEFAAASAETFESEIGISCIAGVGRPCDSAAGMPVSYFEARAAIETGIRHQMPGRVYAIDHQVLERLADLIPAEKAVSFRKEILPEGAEKMLNTETLETIRVFFQNGLNLSTTARQLFIHRNTLLYRLEKIRKATGLDLREFEDAAVFRFIMCLEGAVKDPSLRSG